MNPRNSRGLPAVLITGEVVAGQLKRGAAAAVAIGRFAAGLAGFFDFLLERAKVPSALRCR